MAPTVTQGEASGSPSTASKRRRLSSSSRRGRHGFTGEAIADGGALAAEVAPAASDSMEGPAFVPNSPIRKPYLVEYDSNGRPLSEPSIWPDPRLTKAYQKAKQQYFDKLGQLLKLPTLDHDTLFESIPIQERAEDTIMKASKFILGLSAYIDGVLLRQGSGILMEWNEDKGTILTTAHLFCSRSPNVDAWLGKQEYARDAEVKVQLLHMDDIEVLGELIYLDEQYGFALISVPMDRPEMLPHFCNELMFSEDIFLLGRDKWDLQIGNGKVINKGAGSYQRHHYMYFDADISLCAFGGAVIDVEGDVIGLIASSMEFIPSLTILKCLHLWRTFNCIPRIHLGMKLIGIKCLNLVSKEKISRKYHIDAGLIIVEVSEESDAENHGIRMGDIIQAVNRECISTAIQLENMLLDTCKDYLEKGMGCDSDKDVVLVLDVFNTTKRRPGRIQLTAKLSRRVEIIERGQLLKLPTLDHDTLFESIPIQERAEDTIMKASKFILGLSAYIDGVLLRQGSGILMEWNEDKGTILTTAHLFCSRSPNVDAWLGKQEYARDAEVKVQLLHIDDIEVLGELIYLDEQYGFALISVPMDRPETLPHFCNELMFSEDIFLLGRDKWDLQIGNGKVMNKGAGSYQHHHYMYFDADISPCGFGGAVIDLEGDVIGLITSSMEFIPSSTLKCLHLWRTFNCIPRIHLGMKLFGIKCLNLVSKEKISRKYHIDAGLIVAEVSGESDAENHGVRIGDIIQAVNRECIATAIQLENMLLDTCKGYLEKGIDCDSDKDVVLVANTKFL
ncbi:unnamed protein product [Urochloa humidicola]